MPLRTQTDTLVAELNTAAPLQADDHGLAVHRLEPPLEMLDDIPGNDLGPLLDADGRFEACSLVLSFPLRSISSPPAASSNSKADLRLSAVVERAPGE